MSETEFIDYFRRLPNKFVRSCKLLVAAQPGEQVVGYWGGNDTSIQSPNILAFDTQLLTDGSPTSRWIRLTGSRRDVIANERHNDSTVENGLPLSSINATSYPNLEEEWESVAPAGYSEWLANAVPEKRKAVIEAVQEYDNFYRNTYPFSATDRDVYAVVGGWGLYIYEGEWANYPKSEHIAFSLADAEPYYSIRRLPTGELVSQAIVT